EQQRHFRFGECERRPVAAEQPMPAEMLEETRWVRGKVHIPIIADEACQHAADIPKLKECFDGVNVKLDKSGGMLEAWRMLEIAKALGMKTMLGCMISSMRQASNM